MDHVKDLDNSTDDDWPTDEDRTLAIAVETARIAFGKARLNEIRFERLEAELDILAEEIDEVRDLVEKHYDVEITGYSAEDCDV